ncbi:MAG: SPOR domain-containing protein [Bacteroidales bacterium]|nr:SPOR domain-containing protein [Bacteroidales bacterium]
MDLHFIIQDILTRREGIVIPGLGSFVSSYRSAKIDSEKKVIHPPGKEIRFDPNVTTDSDQILANYIVSKEKVTLSKAKSLIKNFVQHTRNQLAGKGSFTLKGIGTLKMEESGSIELVPENDPASNLGFEEISVEPFEVEKPKKSQKQVSHSQSPPSRKSRTKTILRIAAFTLLLIIIAGGYYTGFFDYLAYKMENQKIVRQIYNTWASGEKQDEPAPVAGDTTLDTASVSKEIKQTLNQMTDKKRALMYKEPRDTKTYHIIAGSFLVRNNAQQYKNQLAKKGYKAEILEKDSLYRISVQSFDKKEDALVRLYQMRDREKLKSVWLLAVQKKDR